MTKTFMTALAHRFRRNRRSRLPLDIRRLSPRIRADIGYPAPDKPSSCKHVRFNYWI